MKSWGFCVFLFAAQALAMPIDLAAAPILDSDEAEEQGFAEEPGMNLPPAIRKPTAAEQSELDSEYLAPPTLNRQIAKQREHDAEIRKISILEATYGPAHMRTASAHMVLGLIALGEENYAEASKHFRPSFAAYEKAYGRTSSEYSMLLAYEGITQYFLKNYVEAIRVIEQARTIQNSPALKAARAKAKAAAEADPFADEDDDPDQLADGLNTALGASYAAVRRYPEAIPLLEQSLQIVMKRKDPEQINQARLLLATALAGAGRAIEAKQYGQQALAQLNDQAKTTLGSQTLSAMHRTLARGSLKMFGVSTAVGEDSGYGAFLTFANMMSTKLPSEMAAYRDQAFQAAQSSHLNDATTAVLEAIAKGRATPTQLKVIGERDRVQHELEVLFNSAFRNVKMGEEIDFEPISRLSGRVDALNAQIEKKYPGYFAFVTPRSATIAAVQKRLRPRQALSFIVAADQNVHIFVITATGADWRMIEGQAAAIGAKLATLQCQIDRKACTINGLKPDPKLFDQAIAFDLYRTLLQPFEPILRDVDHLYFAPAGSFGAIPPGLLVTRDPKSYGGQLVAASWLADRHAITVVPDIIGFVEMAAKEPQQTGATPFIGYGNPILTGKSGARAAPSSDWFKWSPRDQQMLVDGSSLSSLEALPGTEQELTQVAASLGLAAQLTEIVHTGAQDDEGIFKADPMVRSARIVSIATHGLLLPVVRGNGSFGGEIEPGLVFTPPAQATAANDGLLTATEVVALTFSADWVILSACNTATSQNAGDALSSLSRAFLFAGARAVLASHWQVSDEATSQLITRTLANYATTKPGVTRAQALQAAMKQIRTMNPAFAHPRYWAPFSVIAANDD